MDTEYLKKVGIYVLSALLCIGVIFYFGYHVWHSFTKEIETEVATRVTFEETIETSGYIFRTETEITETGSAQSVVPTVYEGEHIRKNGEVAKMYSAADPEAVLRIAEIESQIKILEKYSNADNLTLRDTAGIDKEIYGILSEMRESSSLGNAKDAASQKQALISAVGERTVLTGGFSNPDVEIATLEEEKNTLLQGLGSQIGTLHTPVSGYYYSVADGYEKIFAAEELSDITLTELRGLLATDPLEPAKGGKAVTKSRWYLVCMLEEGEKNTYAPGGKCTVKFKNTDLSLEMDVSTVLYDKEGTALILTSTRMPDGFDFFRVQDVELVKTEYTGLRVSSKALRMVDGVSGVYILDVSTVSFRRVDILYSDENSYIVKMEDVAEETEKTEGTEDTEAAENEETEALQKEYPPLKMHDIIIIEGKGLYEGRVIGD